MDSFNGNGCRRGRSTRPTRTLSSRTPDATEEACREGVRPGRLNGHAGALPTLSACAESAGGSVEDESSECGDQLCDDLLSSTSLLYSAPSCIEDFTERWVTEVMRQYYMTQFGQKSPLPDGIVSYSVEMAGNNDVKGDQDDEAQVRPLLCLTGQTQARRSVHLFLSCHRKTLA